MLATHGHLAYADVGSYIAQTLSRNVVPYAICGAGLATALLRLHRLDPRERLAAVLAVVSTVLVFLHNPPSPYVFLLCLPFLSLWAADAARLAGRLTLRASPAIKTITWAAFGLALLFSLTYNFSDLDNVNVY